MVNGAFVRAEFKEKKELIIKGNLFFIISTVVSFLNVLGIDHSVDENKITADDPMSKMILMK